MDRAIVYNGEELLETDFLNGQKFAMIGLAKLASAVLGAGPLLHNLPCTPGSGLTVSVGAGQVYQLAQIDATAYSSLGTDTHQILKQGILLDPVVLNCPAPGTVGQSINYLVEVAYQDVDTGSTVVPFYNASNPSIPYSGPGGTGTPSMTIRSGKCTVQVKGGTAAATGTQTTPAVDSGFIAAYVVQVDYGMASIPFGNITLAAGAPFLTLTLPNAAPINSPSFTGTPTAPTPSFGDATTKLATMAALQQAISEVNGYLLDTGTANAFVVTLNPTISTYVGKNGLTVRFRAAHANTGACTLNAGPGAITLAREDGAALQSGDVPVNTIITATFDEPSNTWLVNSLVPSQLGALAHEGIGQGLEDDGAGNLRVKLADSSIRRSSSGIQSSLPAGYLANGSTTVLTAADNGKQFTSQGACTLQLPASSALWNGWAIGINANGGAVTCTLTDGTNTIQSGSAGSSYTVSNKTSAEIVCDGAGNFPVNFQTPSPSLSPAPQYISSTTSLTAGNYTADTAAGSFTGTLPATPSTGDVVCISDFAGTWSQYPLIVNPNGKTVNGLSGNFNLDLSGATVSLEYKSGNWSIL